MRRSGLGVIPTELCPKVGDGLIRRRLKLLDPVLKLNPLNDFMQAIGSLV